MRSWSKALTPDALGAMSLSAIKPYGHEYEY